MAHQAIVVVGLGFGDCGKGTMTDALVRRHDAGLVVRYNGGAQAAHTVVTENGRSHVFHQFGSGTFLPGIETLLSRHMLVNPLTLFWEEEELQAAGIADGYSRLYVADDALVTTPYHVIANRLREYARGGGRHGSCGLGIGETVADSLEEGDASTRVADLLRPDTLRKKLLRIRERKRRQLADVLETLRQEPLPAPIAAHIAELDSDEELEATVEVFTQVAQRFHIVDGRKFLGDRLSRPGCTVFEGAQGVLLDQDWGFHPHTTWSDTTARNALSLLKEADFAGGTSVLGILRAYHTRHGDGPFPTEDRELTAALPDTHNPRNDWQGFFRAGWLDRSLARYALQVGGRVDALALTCLDRIAPLPEKRVAVGYRRAGGPFPLIPGERKRLEQREEIGIALRSVEVEYRTAPSCPEEYAAWVASELGLPLAVTSWGPTAADKRFGRDVLI